MKYLIPIHYHDGTLKFLLFRLMLVVSLILYFHIFARAQDQWAAVNTGLSNLDVRELVQAVNGDLLAGTNGDGIFRSSNRGAHWTVTNDGLTTHVYVTNLAVHPDGYVFVGASTVDGDHAIFISLDKSTNWSRVGEDMSLVAVNPHSGTVFAGAYPSGTGVEKLYRSTDLGQTWSPVTMAHDSWGESFDDVTAMAFDQNGQIYAGFMDPVLYGSIFRSADDGDSWIETNWQPASETYIGSIHFGVSNTIYIAAPGILNGIIRRSRDQGAHWESISAGSPDSGLPYLLGEMSIFFANRPAGDIYLTLGTDPRYPRSDLESQWGVYRSADGGDSWTNISTGLTNRDVQCILAAPDNTLYVGTKGGGIFRSTESVPVELSEFSVE